MIGAGAPFDMRAAVLVLVRTCFNEGNYCLNHIAEEVGAKLVPGAWAKLVQEVGKAMAVEVLRAFVTGVIKHEAQRLEMDAKSAVLDAEWYCWQAAALRGELDCDALAMF